MADIISAASTGLGAAVTAGVAILVACMAWPLAKKGYSMLKAGIGKA